jgi:hypothetical protein
MEGHVESGDSLQRIVTPEEVKCEGTRTPEGRSVRVHLSHPLEKDVWWKICHFGGLTLWEKEEQRSVDWKSSEVGTKDES